MYSKVLMALNWSIGVGFCSFFVQGMLVLTVGRTRDWLINVYLIIPFS